MSYSFIFTLYKTLLKYGAFLCALLVPFTLQATETTALETVNLQLKWKHAYQFAGYYAAIEKGYYQDAGLDVILHEHDGKKSPANALLDGDVDYAVTGSQIVVHRAHGKPVVVLASVFQHSAYAFLVKASSGIKQVEDFSGKRVMLLDDGIQDAALLATLRRAGLNKNDYSHITSSFDPFSLTRGETEVFNAYVSDQGFTLEEAGIKGRYILPKQYGVDFYGDVLTTTENEITNNPQRVQSFLDATLKGWEYALLHPDKIIDLIIEKYNTQNLSRGHLKYEASVSRELIQPLLIKIGHMNPARWQHIKNIFEELDFLEPDSNIEGLMYLEHNKPISKIQWIINHWLMLTTIMVILFILFLLIFTVQLRHLVKKRTEDLEESEQHWRALINAEPACVKTLNSKCELMSMNPAGLAMIDADNIEQVRGARIADLIDEKYQKDFMQLNKNTFNGQPGSLLFKAKGLKGRDVWLETYAVPFCDTKGNITRSLSVTQDVTERIRAEDEKLHLQYELEMAHKMEALGHLTGGIAHDFNNLLGIIIGYSGLALPHCKDNKEQKLSKYLGNILDAGERAKNLIAQMLAFSRHEKVNNMPIQLHSLIKEDIKLLQSALPSSIKIQSDISEDLPAVILSPTQLNQILMNLSINAKDAMSGQGTLTISLNLLTNINHTCAACRKRIDGEWIALSVTDTGTGIEPKTLKYMFDPFFTTKEVGQGSGMGLAVIYGVAHNNDGHIIVETEKNIGTTFRILFPVNTAGVDEIGELGASRITASKGNSEHILIVDDESELGSLIGELLNENGYRTTVMTDSVKALKLFNEHANDYALLVTDQTMPNITGIELSQKVKALRPDLPVILCSGFSERIDEDQLRSMNIHYLKKPVDANQFLEMVHDVVDRSVKNTFPAQ